MKVTREQAAQNRDTVVNAASRLFRVHGVDGIGIGEIMRESGLTHGGFYGQFASKDALAGEACARALEGSVARWTRIVAEHPGDPVSALAMDYLSARNRDAPETGCALVALAADAARRGEVGAAFRAGLLGLAEVVEQAAPDQGREGALAIVSQMVGAMVLARSVDDKDISNAILAATRKALCLGKQP